MKVNYKILQNKNIFIETDGKKPKNDCELLELLKKIHHAIEQGQKSREKNTLGEIWACESLGEILDCLVIKK